MPKIPEEIKRQLSGLPAAARILMPDGYVVVMLCQQAEDEIVKDNNVNNCIAIMSLLCRRMAVLFNGLAAQQEKLLQDGSVKVDG